MINYEFADSRKFLENVPLFFHYGNTKIKLYSSNWHRDIEITSITSGTGKVTCNGTVYDAAPGDIFVFNSDVIHTIESSGTEMKFICFIINFDFCTWSGIPVDKLKFRERITDPALSAEFNNVLSQYRNFYDSPCFSTRIKATLLLLLVFLRENYTETESAEDKRSVSAFVKTTIDYIRNHLSDPLDVDSLASLVHVSRCYLTREFKRLTGRSIVEFINWSRCYQAKQLLDGNRTVAEVATACGFNNLSYFSRTYRRYIGNLPSLAAEKRKV